MSPHRRPPRPANAPTCTSVGATAEVRQFRKHREPPDQLFLVMGTDSPLLSGLIADPALRGAMVVVRVGAPRRLQRRLPVPTIDVRTDEVGRRFQPGVRLRTDSGKQLMLERVKWHQGRLLVAFEGHSDRTAVEQLRGEVLNADVPADETPSEPGEYFDRQLVGLAVLEHTGRRVGLVTQVEHYPAQDMLLVDVDGEIRMVPFVSDLVPEVNLAEGYLRLAPVEGLLEDLE